MEQRGKLFSRSFASPGEVATSVHLRAGTGTSRTHFNLLIHSPDLPTNPPPPWFELSQECVFSGYLLYDRLNGHGVWGWGR